MKTWVHACILATISGLSLPVGAILGIILSPVRDTVCAAWLAFGAGALLFAVTVELYGHALHELDHGRSGIYEMVGTILGAFAGALLYLSVNRWLEASCEDHEEEEPLKDLEDIEELDGESDASSLVGSEAASLIPKQRGPVKPILKGGPVKHLDATEERRESPARQDGDFAHREDSFTRNVSFARDQSFVRYPSFSRSKNASFAYSRYSHLSETSSFRSRGRDSVFNKMCSPSGPTTPSKTLGGPGSIAEGIAENSGSNLDSEAQKGNSVAFALFLGLLVDGVPEGILMGFLAAEGHLSEVLIVSLLVANFPEAFSSASLMVQGGISIPIIISMWTGLCLMVGILAGGSCFALLHFFPSYPAGELPQSLLISAAVIEGITGGAMISCISTVMLPEAFARAGGHGNVGPLMASSGFLCTAGFLVAVSMKAFEHHYHDHPY